MEHGEQGPEGADGGASFGHELVQVYSPPSTCTPPPPYLLSSRGGRSPTKSVRPISSTWGPEYRGGGGPGSRGPRPDELGGPGRKEWGEREYLMQGAGEVVGGMPVLGGRGGV